MSANLMSANLLSANLLSANLMSANSLATGQLGSVVQAALQDPDYGANDRTLFHYIVTCALTPDQSVSYTWSDAQGDHDVVEQGQLGLAPEWATGPVYLKSQERVSGCVASRVNYFGVSVQISVRNPVLLSETPASELAAYPYVEGAFWGNLFTSSPALYSCYDPANAAHSLAAQRACATGYHDANGTHACGIITLTGSCADSCFRLDATGQFYRGCGDDPNGRGSGITAITIGLQ